MKLRRLTDRIETDSEGNEVITKRYGLWGTTVEVEKCGKKIEMIYPDGKREKYKSLEEAEVAMKKLVW